MILHLPFFFSSKQHVSPATTSLKINENKKDINFRVSDLPRVTILIPVANA